MSGTVGSTLLLDVSTWDLCLDASGNIALATAPYSLAQDCASAIRTFLGEVYYDTTEGVPYFQEILAHNPPLALLKAQLAQAALTVTGCASAAVYITSITARRVSGQVQVTNSAGVVSVAAF